MEALKFECFPNYTYQDYVTWEGNWELIKGVPYAMAPSPMKTHQNLTSTINAYLYFETLNCPNCEVLIEFDYKISNDTILRPDIVLVCDEENENYLTKTPEIVVEIISQSTAFKDENIKFRLYEMEKVKYYVLVYPNDLIAKIYKLNNSKYEKEGIFSKETYEFTHIKCPVKLDFSKIFSKFRK